EVETFFVKLGLPCWESKIKFDEFFNSIVKETNFILNFCPFRHFEISKISNSFFARKRIHSYFNSIIPKAVLGEDFFVDFLHNELCKLFYKKYSLTIIFPFIKINVADKKEFFACRYNDRRVNLLNTQLGYCVVLSHCTERYRENLVVEESCDMTEI